MYIYVLDERDPNADNNRVVNTSAEASKCLWQLRTLPVVGWLRLTGNV